jgi:hypothetical protein
MTAKSIEVVFSYIFLLAVSLLSVYLKLDFLSFTAVFTIPVIVYLLLKLKKYAKKIIIEALVISIPLEIVLDSIAHLSKSWYVPSIFGIRIFGNMPIDDLIWTFLYVLFILSSYSYFFDHYKSKKLKKSFKKMTVSFGVFLTGFLLINHLSPQILVIPYFYAILMVVFLIFTLVLLVEHPKLYQNVTLMVFYSFIPSVLFEYVALKLGHWYFETGYHLAYIVVGEFTVPFEEFMFYFLAVTTTVLIHEMFGDNKRNS